MATGLSEDKMVINYSAPLNSIIITHHFFDHYRKKSVWMKTKLRVSVLKIYSISVVNLK